MKKNLYESLCAYSKLSRSSFHTPGHKCKISELSKLYNLDLTELPQTDSLYEASGIIREAEKNLSKLYSTAYSAFSSGGNTLCIQTMFKLVSSSPGDVILCDRVIHRSAISTMALLDLKPVWMKRNINNESMLPESIDFKDFEKKLSDNPSAKGLYLTSPSYHGILQNIKKISSDCKKYNIPVMVDNAHGSHLMFLKNNLHPIFQGCAMSSDSAHKTLPVLTGGAWLHVNDERFINNVKQSMLMFGSTSPSYPVMASMDLCRIWLEEFGKISFEDLEFRVKKIKDVARKKGIYIPDDSISDPVRITLGVFNIGYTGYEFREHLYNHNIEPEMCDENYVVLIATPFNDDLDFERLYNAIFSAEVHDKKVNNICPIGERLPEVVLTPREALMAKSVSKSLKDCKNKIASDIVCPCPPGVPVVMPGEKIGDEELYALKSYGISEISVVK
ncbi:MAG: aminotransferase class I/II-fold pyridoxal phosphate-dependent enzyme [Clostridia bacterium]|nr:aminotransferase class I/II-fold pyridoxal phosphate-dependent enzyme [Clostridia bacterium]